MYVYENELYVRQYQQRKVNKFAKSLDSFEQIVKIVNELKNDRIISSDDRDEILDLISDKLDL